MQYIQMPWTVPLNYEQFYPNLTNHHYRLSSDASSLTNGYDSSTSYLYDVLPSVTSRISPIHYEVLNSNILYCYFFLFIIIFSSIIILLHLGLLCKKEKT